MKCSYKRLEVVRRGRGGGDDTEYIILIIYTSFLVCILTGVVRGGDKNDLEPLISLQWLPR